MNVLILIFLVVTGGAPTPETGTTETTVSTVEAEPGNGAVTTTDDGGDTVRKTPIG